MSIRNGVTVRGTSNGNERGSAEQRRKRKAWLLEAYAADVKAIRLTYAGKGPYLHRGSVTIFFVSKADLDRVLAGQESLVEQGYLLEVEVLPSCRCYRCGNPLVFDTLSVDRRVPGCQGGTYRRDNIRPACLGCNSETGGPLAKAKVKKVAKDRTRKPKPLVEVLADYEESA